MGAMFFKNKKEAVKSSVTDFFSMQANDLENNVVKFD
jgi:hypothetical protein